MDGSLWIVGMVLENRVVFNEPNEGIKDVWGDWEHVDEAVMVLGLFRILPHKVYASLLCNRGPWIEVAGRQDGAD